MMNVNKVMLLGRLGADPELRFNPNGNAVLNFRMATTKTWPDRDGRKQERTEWHRIVFWKKTAEQLERLLFKGGRVYVEGELRTNEWERDGQKHRTTEISADHVIAIDRRPQGTTAHTPAEESSDAIPF